MSKPFITQANEQPPQGGGNIMTNPGSGNRSIEGHPEEIPAKIQHSGDLGLEQPTRQFNTPLHEAVDQGLLSPTPDSPAALVEKEINKKPGKLRLKLAAGATAVAAFVGGGVALFGGEGAPAKDPASNSAAATPEQGSASASPEISSEVVSVETMSSLDGQASPAMIQEVLTHPVAFTEFSSPEQALNQLNAYLNVYLNSGSCNIIDGVCDYNGPQSPESEAQGLNMLKTIIGPGVDEPKWQTSVLNNQELRGYIATTRAMVEDMKLGGEEGFTYNLAKSVISKELLSDSKSVFIVEASATTNASDVLVDNFESSISKQKITIEKNSDGNWYITDLITNYTG